jgi:ABC-2 type transport system ATP-binding protein
MTPDADPVLEMVRLTKTFGRQTAVRDVSLTVGRGEVYGFLGPNGAGKSTTIRMLLSLIRPSSGEVRLWGRDVRAHPGQLARVGSLVDGGTLYPFLTARENLAVLGALLGRPDARRADALLDQVGLATAADKRVKSYSTGMKQRLGVAAALLNDPELVILDEPSNGLDVSGIGEMRALILRLARDEGRTVFLCSHLLHEVEQVCDRVAIVDKGRVIQEASMTDLLERQGGVRVEAAPIADAMAVLARRFAVTDAEGALRVKAARDDVPSIVSALVEAKIQVFHVSVERRSLEDAFISITQDAGS